jgi:hypothetical protein
MQCHVDLCVRIAGRRLCNMLVFKQYLEFLYGYEIQGIRWVEVNWSSSDRIVKQNTFS